MRVHVDIHISMDSNQSFWTWSFSRSVCLKKMQPIIIFFLEQVTTGCFQPSPKKMSHRGSIITNMVNSKKHRTHVLDHRIPKVTDIKSSMKESISATCRDSNSSAGFSYRAHGKMVLWMPHFKMNKFRWLQNDTLMTSRIALLLTQFKGHLLGGGHVF